MSLTLHVICMGMSSSSLLYSSLLDERPDIELDEELDEAYCAPITVSIARSTVCSIPAPRQITQFVVERYGIAVRF